MDNDPLGVKLILGVVAVVFLLQLATGLAASLACAIGWTLYYAVTIAALAAAGIAAVVVPVLACAWIDDLLRGTRYAERWLQMVTNSGRVLTGRRPVHPCRRGCGRCSGRPSLSSRRRPSRPGHPSNLRRGVSPGRRATYRPSGRAPWPQRRAVPVRRRIRTCSTVRSGESWLWALAAFAARMPFSWHYSHNVPPARPHTTVTAHPEQGDR